MFPPQTYSARRATLASRFEGGLLLFPGNGESPMNYADNCYPFRQDSTFLYYFGLDQPHLAAVIDVDAGTSTIFGNELTIDDIVWMRDLPTISARAERVGVTETRPLDELDAIAGAAEAAGRPVRYLPPYRAETTLLLSRTLGIPPAEVRERASDEFISAVVNQRICKSAEEIDEIEKAVVTAVEMHTAAIRMVRPGMLEAEVAGEMGRIAVAAGA
jgi:Xaa-Pro aminopeptidase